MIRAKRTKTVIFLFLATAILPVAIFSVSRAAATDCNLLTDEDDRKECEKLNEKAEKYQEIIDLKQRQASLLTGQVSMLGNKIAALESQIREKEREMETLAESLDLAEAGIEEKERLIGRQKEVLAELIREYHAGMDDDTSIFLAADTGNSDLFLKKEDWMAETGERIRTMLREIENTKAALVAERDLLEKRKTEVVALKEELHGKNEEIAALKGQKESQLADTRAEEEKYREKLSKIEEEINNLEANLVVGSDVPSFRKGLLEYPVKNPIVSQWYGKTSFAKTAYASGSHNGIDFADSIGTPILAAYDGKVVGVGDCGRYAYGKWVAVDHGNGLITLYGHLSSQSVKRGEKVEEGEKIGRMGSTGYSTGSHLHFSVFSSSSYKVVESSIVRGLFIPVGASINPTSYLP